MSHLSQFNVAVHEFVADLKKMQLLHSDIAKLESYIEITRVNARAIVRNFQNYFLRDIFVTNILTNNVNFFIDYDPSDDLSTTESNGNNHAHALIRRIQDLVRTMQNTGANDNINKTFDWIKILCFHAYQDLGIDATVKFRTLQSERSTTTSR